MQPTSSPAAQPAPAAAVSRPSSLLERRFALAERGTNVRTEVLAGITTFLTMAYIILVNPAILGQAGLPVAGVAAATCFAAAFGCILMGISANVPLALAPGMGLNAYMSYTVVQQMHVPWPVALGCVFVSGLGFLLLTALGVRQMIVRAIPPHLLEAVAGSIGLFIGFIGLRNAGIIVGSPNTFVALGNLRDMGPMLTIFGLAVIGLCSAWQVRGAVLIGIVLTTLASWIVGPAPAVTAGYDLHAMTGTVFKMDLAGVFGLGGSHGLGLLEILFVFLFVDLFDNICTLVAVTKRAGIMREDGDIPGLNRILYSDAIATMVGAAAGTSTVTSYVESAAGVQAGGRTGLTSVVTGMLFLLAMLAAPYAALVPLAATAPALILVGALMMRPLADIAWDDPMAALPAFLTIIVTPLTFSIANGLAFGIVAHAVLTIGRGKARRGDTLLFVLAALFVARFAYLGVS